MESLTRTGLKTDFYEITMAYALWKQGEAYQNAAFSLHFRNLPFGGGYAVSAGLASVIDSLSRFGFGELECDYLRSLKAPSGSTLFPDEFLDFLSNQKFECSIDAVPEGSLVFPHEPLVFVRGPLWQCLLIESMILNQINFQTLIATKAARLCWAAGKAPVFEFGMRRAQGPDGALTASRAAYIGGTTGTSNTEAGRIYGIPVKGTLAHSWIMAFGNESNAFERYLDSLPELSVLLVDTYDTLDGVRNAIKAAKKLDIPLSGIRLDSGDLAYLSQGARKILDESGFHNTQIIASNEIDERIIQSLGIQGAQIDIWGVGTKLVTAKDDPALNGVYKLQAIEKNGKWEPRVKISSQLSKMTNPGMHKVYRYINADGLFEADVIADELEDSNKIDRVIDPNNPYRFKAVNSSWEKVEISKPIFERGALVYAQENLDQTRARLQLQLNSLHEGHKRLENPHEYVIGLSQTLSNQKEQLIRENRKTK